MTPRGISTTGHTSFIGRDGELTEIAALFRAGARLVTLVGPGGVGKTRLAQTYVEQCVDSETSVCRVISLEAIAQPETVLSEIASAFGLRETAYTPELAGRIATQLRTQAVFLFLDNFEHLLDAAPDIRQLIDAIPGLSVLATSRSPLHIKPEQRLPIEPLAMPAPGDERVSATVWSNPAVRLFVDRARAVNASIDAGSVGEIAEIVRRLDGLPLAIELAAAAMWRLRTPALLLSQLDPILPVLDQGWRDASDRHATMDAAIDWSYQLLDPEEQALFVRLSVFAGGFDLEFAQRLARGRAAGGPYPYNDGYGEPNHGGSPLSEDRYHIGSEVGDYSLAVALSPLDGDVGELLESLAEKYLLQRVPGRDGFPRYRMLETIRGYGLERLEVSGEAEAVRHAHAAVMMAFAESSAALIWTSHATPWMIRQFDVELGNLRAAIAWEESHGAAGAELLVRTVDPIWQYFQFRGMLVDVRHWLEHGLGFETIPAIPRGYAMAWLGLLRWIQGDDAGASRAVDEATALGKLHNLNHIEARALVPTAAAIAWRTGDLQKMASCIERAQTLYQEWDDPIGISICLLLQGQLLRMLEQPMAARDVLEQAFTLSAAVGYGWGMATTRYYAAEAMHDQGDIDSSITLLIDALDLYWEEEDGWGGASVTSSTAAILAERKEPELAARFFGIASTLLSRAGAFLPPSQLVEYAAAEERVRATLGPEAFKIAYQAGAALDPRSGVVEVRHYLATSVGQRATSKHDVAPLTIAPAQQFPKLTEAEHKVVVLLLRGFDPKEIARELNRGYSTIAGHLQNARAKWGARTNAELAAMAERSGLF